MVRLELTRLRQMILSHSRLPITPHPLKSGTRSGSRTHTPKRQSLNLMRLPIPPFEYRKVVPPPASVSTRGSRYSDTKIFPPIGTWPCPSNGHVASINWRKYHMKPLVSCLPAFCAKLDTTSSNCWMWEVYLNWVASNVRAVLLVSFCRKHQISGAQQCCDRKCLISSPFLMSWLTRL